jgi:DNA-binding NarL/FixJ family response regulator
MERAGRRKGGRSAPARLRLARLDPKAVGSARRREVRQQDEQRADHERRNASRCPSRATARGLGKRPWLRRLTARQQEVLHLLADGVPAKTIAAQLGVVEATVRNHIRAILVALDAHSQLEAIANARRLQLID